MFKVTCDTCGKAWSYPHKLTSPVICMDCHAKEKASFPRQFTPVEMGAIISAFTGVMLGEFDDMHKYIEKILGRSVWTNELGDKALAELIKVKAKKDMLELHEFIIRSKKWVK